MRIGVVGLGAMGELMARNLRERGVLVAVWNRTELVAQQFSEQTGVAVSASPAVLAADCEIIFLCVSADQDVLDLIDQLAPGLSAGDVVIDTSTVSANTAQQVAKTLKGQGVEFLDAPVSGGVEGARNATLAMMVGGDAEVLERMKPILNVLASNVVHMGPVGAGQATKAVNQIMAAGINQAVTEALSFGQAMDLPMDKLIKAVGSGAAGNWFLSHRGASMVAGSFDPGFKLALHHKDLKICQQMAAEEGARLPMLELTLDHYESLLDAGFGEKDISVLFKGKKNLW